MKVSIIQWLPVVLLIVGLSGCTNQYSLTTRVNAASTAEEQPQQESSGLPDQIELGRVAWGRDLEAAKRQSAESGKPVFVLFQEVPGCQTCQDFGSGPLSHPLMVEAIEELFEPVLVYNNKPSDEAILKSFNEPSWNNPVVRFLDSKGDDVIARADGVWNTVPLAGRMAESLRAVGRDVPPWFHAVVASQPSSATVATFAMHCYWVGEAKLGALDGVLSTRSAWIGDKEVVQLSYDADVIDYTALVESAHELECASTVYTSDQQQFDSAAEIVGKELVQSIDDKTQMRDAKASDQKYALTNTNFRLLPLTELQAVKVNGALHAGNPDAARKWLSPRQTALFEQIERSLKQDPESLGQWQRPESDEQLADYNARLREALQNE